MERLKKSSEFKGLFEPFVGAKAVDDHTVDIETKKPYPLLLNMATYIFPMDRKFYSGKDKSGKPKDAIVKVGPSFARDHESGTGPFYVASYEQGVKMVYKRFKDYWDKKSPGNVTEMILTPIKEDATRVAALLAGDVDVILPVPPQDYDRIDKNPKLNLVTMAGSRIITVQLNQSRKKEFADKKVRQAIVYAVNNVGIAKKIMKARATAAAQMGPKGFLGYQEDLKPRFDLKKAKALMKEAGYAKGFSCTMIAPNNRYVNDEKIAQAFVSMVSKIGIKVDLKTMPKAQYWPQFRERVADIQMIGWHPDTEDSANYHEYLTMCRDEKTGLGEYNSGAYCNKKVDDMLLAAQSETDPAKRKKILQEVERIVYDDAAYVPFHWQHLSWAGKKSVKNLADVVNVMNFPYFGDLAVE
jgi:peptide/nickel transport system substrate-binding protein